MGNLVLLQRFDPYTFRDLIRVFRQSPLRREIIFALMDATEPLTVTEIIDMVKPKLEARTIEGLVTIDVDFKSTKKELEILRRRELVRRYPLSNNKKLPTSYELDLSPLDPMGISITELLDSPL